MLLIRNTSQPERMPCQSLEPTSAVQCQHFAEATLPSPWLFGYRFLRIAQQQGTQPWANRVSHTASSSDRRPQQQGTTRRSGLPATIHLHRTVHSLVPYQDHLCHRRIMQFLQKVRGPYHHPFAPYCTSTVPVFKERYRLNM